jgi:hypothetical protein
MHVWLVVAVGWGEGLDDEYVVKHDCEGGPDNAQDGVIPH